jgi:hypothetical protein
MSNGYSPGLANLLAQTIGGAVADGTLNFYAGNPSAGGTLLGSGKLPIAPFASATAGEISLAGQWFATMSVAGTVSYARLADPTGAQSLPLTVGLSGSGADIIVSGSSVTFEIGQVLSVTSFNYTVS